MQTNHPNTYVILRPQVLHGTAPEGSYWVGCDRAELTRRIAARRHQQACPSQKEMAFEPGLAATASWQEARARYRWQRGLR